MKKSITIFAALLLAMNVSFAQSTEVNPTVASVQVETAHLLPIEYSTTAEKIKMASPRIEVIKNELAKPNLSREEIVNYKELLWRFENAIVVNENK
jgi:uncharacterized GH25 family protein